MKQYCGYTISDFLSNSVGSIISDIEDNILEIENNNNQNKDKDEWFDIDNSIIYMRKDH